MTFVSRPHAVKWLLGMLLSCFVTADARADIVSFDDFEGLNLLPFSVASSIGDGTDWTRDIRTGTPREWTVDNSLMTGTTTELAYLGWAAMDIDSWIAEQGTQVGRGSTLSPALGPGTNNTVLIADPDAWDDYTTGANPNGYNSFISRAYNLTGHNPNLLAISFVYEFVTEDNQMGNVQVSFDNGVTWQTLLAFDSTTVPNDTFFSSATGQNTFVAGVDFTATSTNMLLRFGCFDSGNDWWFLVDNISVTTSDGFSDMEDFEGLTLVPFTTMVGDGTDYTQDIPNWVIDNSGNLGFSSELAYNGWAALDVASWASEQGGQGRTLFNIEDPHNTTMVADGDAFYDYDFNLAGTGPAPPKAVNTYVSRFFDLSLFDSTTISIQFEYEFRIENAQLGVFEVSFDGGNSFTRLLELDNNDGANDVILADIAMFQAGVDFPATATNQMVIRFGYLCADNNWWFAFDNVLVQANAAPLLVGDINGDGVINLLDVAPFIKIVVGGNFIMAADINMDGRVDLLDVAPFTNLLTGG